jgi:hypothetical protein
MDLSDVSQVSVLKGPQGTIRFAAEEVIDAGHSDLILGRHMRTLPGVLKPAAEEMPSTGPFARRRHVRTHVMVCWGLYEC